jgi:hypothetical protein
MWDKNYCETYDASLFLCGCGMSEHQVIFQLYDFNTSPDEEVDADEVWMSVHLSACTYMNVLQRVWWGIKHVLNIENTHAFDDVIIEEKDVERMLIKLGKIRSRRAFYRSNNANCK